MRAYFVIPGDINQPTGGYGYDRQVLAHAGSAGLDLQHCAIPGGYPAPDAAALEETSRRIAALPAGTPLLIDGLAYGAMPEAMIRDFGPRPIIELCHHPLALEPGLTAAAQSHFHATERRAMALAAAIIVTGPLTKRIVTADFGVPADKVTVALPGTEPAPRATGSGGDGHAAGPLRLLAVGSIIPRKGYGDLIEAVALLREVDWQLDIIGSKTHSPETVEALERLIQARGLGTRVRLLGAQSAENVAQAYARADLFVLASHFEGYGMVIAEAMARGLPIVTTEAGAVVDTLAPHAGIQVPVGSIQALASSIQELLVNNDKRLAISAASWAAGQGLPRWQQTAATIHSVLREVAP